ncbi:MAG: ABC transporter ATP-binding protein [Muribaculaceae bacterium]|nr:ABC transporter ATP-binding protein [Muribaculaceae bacterium]
MDNQNNAFLSVENLAVEYTSNGEVVHAVNGVSFTLDRGRTLGLVGETGAGKTTIAKSILRILPEPPARIRGGRIVLDGVDLLGLSRSEMYKIRGNKISMIFQDPMTSLNPVHKIGEQITEVIELHNPGMTHGEAKRRSIEMLERVGIPADRYGEYPHQFSGGMKQRVVIAMALACNPELLLADEPTSALDVTIQAEVLAMIKALRDDLGTAMVMITHDLGIVAQVCDEVAIVYAGEILEYGSTREIFQNCRHPYTIGLFGAIPKLDAKVRRLNAIKGLPPDPTNMPRGCRFHPRCQMASDACRRGGIPFCEVGPGHFCRCIHPEGRA